MQNSDEGFLTATLLYRAAAELELRLTHHNLTCTELLLK